MPHARTVGVAWPGCLLAALLGQSLLYTADSSDTAELTFEILPDDADGTGESTGELTNNFLSSIHGLNGESNSRPNVDNMPLLRSLSRDVESTEVLQDRHHVAVDITSQSKIRARAAGDIELKGTGGLVGRLVDPVDMVSGGLNFQSLGSITMVGGETEMMSLGDMTAVASEAAHLGASELSAQITNGISTDAGGDVQLLAGGDASILSGGSGSATFGGALEASGTSISIEGSEKLSTVASAVDVLGVD